MDCSECQRLIWAYVDSELDTRGTIDYSAHLGACTSCSERYGQALKLRRTVKSHAAAFSASDFLQRRIQDALPRAATCIKPKRVIWLWLNVGMAAGLTLASVLAFFLYTNTASLEKQTEQEVVASHVRSLMADHLSDVISTDQHTIKPWFNDKLAYSPTVHDFSPEGYSLIGCRLDYLDQRPVAAMVYQHRKHVINLFVWPDKTFDNAQQRSMSRLGYQIIHWTQSGMRYWVISDTDIRDLNEFKLLLIAQIEQSTPQ